MRPAIFFVFGKKKKEMSADLVSLLSLLYGMSNTEVKRKIREGSFEWYVGQSNDPDIEFMKPLDLPSDG
jgi:hypothetical protein